MVNIWYIKFKINLTKLDILSGQEKIKIAVNYFLNGEKLEIPPASIELWNGIEVEYVEVDGWMEEIASVKTFEELPVNAKTYVEKLENILNLKITSIGVGVRREDIIFR